MFKGVCMKIIRWLFLSVLCFQPDAQASKSKLFRKSGDVLKRGFDKGKHGIKLSKGQGNSPIQFYSTQQTPKIKTIKGEEYRVSDVSGDQRWYIPESERYKYFDIPNIGVEGFSETESPVDIQEYTEPKEQVPYQRQSIFGGPQSEPKMPSGKHHYHTSTSSFFKKAGALDRGYKKGSGKLFEKNMQGRKYSTEGVDTSSSEYWKLSREGRRELHQQKAVDIEQKLREISTPEQNKQLDLIEDLEKKKNQRSVEFWIEKKKLDEKMKKSGAYPNSSKVLKKIHEQDSIFSEKMYSVLRNEVRKLNDSYNETQQSLYNQMTTEKYSAEDFFTDLEEVGKQRKRLENLPEMRENLRQKELMERAKKGVIYEGGALGELPVRRIKDEPSEREELSDLEKSQKSNQIFLNKEVSRHKRELRKQKKDIERYQQQEENPQQQSKRWYNPFTWR